MKYEHEIHKMFEDALRQPWDDDEDWEAIRTAISNNPEFNLEQMAKDIETGIKNGYSLEYQMNLCRDILRKMKETM